LQVEGADKIMKIGLAVDACLETYKLAQKNLPKSLFCHCIRAREGSGKRHLFAVKLEGGWS